MAWWGFACFHIPMPASVVCLRGFRLEPYTELNFRRKLWAGYGTVTRDSIHTSYAPCPPCLAPAAMPPSLSLGPRPPSPVTDRDELRAR